VVNKIDAVSEEEVFKAISTYKDACSHAEIVPVSALKGKNKDELIKTLFKYLPYGPQFYDEDTITDQPERQIVSELIREQALRLLDKEIR
jgi:GTP-binding protein Era